MSHEVFKITEITGTDPDSIEAAVNKAVARAAKTVRNMRWFEVVETRGYIDDDKVAQWQVTVRLGFAVD